MAKSAADQVLSALRSSASELNERTGDTIAQIADSVSRVLDEAGSEGAKIKKTLVRNWTTLERPSRGRRIPILIGLLGLGAALAYFARRASSNG
jgi:hypothetical protein